MAGFGLRYHIEHGLVDRASEHGFRGGRGARLVLTDPPQELARCGGAGLGDGREG